MTKQRIELSSETSNVVHHLTPHRQSTRGQADKALKVPAMIDHFREQSDKLLDQNQQLIKSQKAMHAKIDRLVQEMHGVRTGQKTEAFARIGGADAAPDLPTVRPDAALIYTLPAQEIGEKLKLRASEIGLLLSQCGVKWADNGDYQEVARRKKFSQQRYWIDDMPQRLSEVLNANDPGHFGIRDKAVLAIFRKWTVRRAAHSAA